MTQHPFPFLRLHGREKHLGTRAHVVSHFRAPWVSQAAGSRCCCLGGLFIVLLSGLFIHSGSNFPVTASPNVTPSSADSSLWGVWRWGRGRVSVLVAYFASLTEGARTLWFFPAYLPESLWMLLTYSLFLAPLQMTPLYLLLNSSTQCKGLLSDCLSGSRRLLCPHLAKNSPPSPIY